MTPIDKYKGGCYNMTGCKTARFPYVSVRSGYEITYADCVG